jgi:hypothetical protein
MTLTIPHEAPHVHHADFAPAGALSSCEDFALAYHPEYVQPTRHDEGYPFWQGGDLDAAAHGRALYAKTFRLLRRAGRRFVAMKGVA